MRAVVYGPRHSSLLALYVVKVLRATAVPSPFSAVYSRAGL